MDLMWWSLVIGGILGVVLSTLFGIYSSKTSNSWSMNILGMNSGDLITDAIFLILAASVIFLATVSGLVRDLYYPINRPWYFTAEVFLMAVPPALTFLAMVAMRGYSLTTADVWEKFSVLLIKFGLLHVLLQFSGFYSDILPPVQYTS